MSNFLEAAVKSNLYVQPIHLVLSITSNLIHIRVLCSRGIVSSACTQYFISSTVYSTMYMCVVCPTQFVRASTIGWPSTNIVCRIHSYFIFLLPVQAKLMLFLAILDRYLLTCKSVRLQRFSSIESARRNIIITTTIVSLYLAPMLIIYEMDPVVNRCFQNTGTLSDFYIFSQVILLYCAAPLIMLTLSLLTIANIRRKRRTIGPGSLITRNRPTERQLTRVSILQLFVHFILIIPYGVLYGMHGLFEQTRTPTTLAIRYIAVIWHQIDYYCSFYLYVFSSQIYRQEFIKLMNRAKAAFGRISRK